MIALDEAAAHRFLGQNKIADYEIKKVAGDASFRSYYRIFCGQKTYMLMFAPPPHEDVRPFAKVDKFLVEHGFSAPQIFAQDEETGFLLLEDFGDDTYSKVLACDISVEIELYQKACDCLLELHQKEALQDLPPYNHAALFREVMLFVDWYLPLQKKAMTAQEKAQYKFLWFEVFDYLAQMKSLRDHLQKNENPVVVLRDYHADNLMILPDRQGSSQVGLLDFQDALLGSRAYDLVSLLEDARRDLSAETRDKIFAYYLSKSNCDHDDFKTDYEILSLQRNIKILGIFARLSMRDGKHHYINFIPRVLGFVMSRLESKNPVLAEINHLIKKFV